jgi:hypothetical protein
MRFRPEPDVLQAIVTGTSPILRPSTRSPQQGDRRAPVVMAVLGLDPRIDPTTHAFSSGCQQSRELSGHARPWRWWLAGRSTNPRHGSVESLFENNPANGRCKLTLGVPYFRV